MCQSRTTPRDDKCIRPEHPAHGGVMLCTVQCRPAAACARKSPPRVHSKESRQDKTSLMTLLSPTIYSLPCQAADGLKRTYQKLIVKTRYFGTL
jgi:hypothetical protein